MVAAVGGVAPRMVLATLLSSLASGSCGSSKPAGYSAAPSPVAPLPGCGAEVQLGANCAARLVAQLNSGGGGGPAAGLAELLRAAVTDHGFVRLRDMSGLTPAGHIAFTRLFGTPGAHPRRGKPPGLPCMDGTDCLVDVSTNDRASAQFSLEIRADHWHADVTFVVAPLTYTSLLARAIPGNGKGDTMWACAARAYESLSPALQQTLGTLAAVHRDKSGLGATATHPVVRALPGAVAGRNRSLFVNHQFTSHLAGWRADESEPLLGYLLRRLADPEHVHRHRWAEGDLIIWDNRQTLHHGIFDLETPAAAGGDEAGGGGGGVQPVRTLHRTTAAYEEPIAAASAARFGRAAEIGAGTGSQETCGGGSGA